jgi:TRCF domain
MPQQNQQLIDLYNELARLQREGKLDEAKKFLAERFAQLPEDVQGELLATMYVNALQERVAQEDALAEVITKGIETLDALDALKKKIEGETSAQG